MHSIRRFHSSIFGASLRPQSATLAILLMLLFFLLVLLLVLLTPQPAQGQTFKLLHTFTGPDGAEPYAGITLDAAGNLYGTTVFGGTAGEGNIFELSRRNGRWVLNSILTFSGNNGFYPFSGVVFGPDGALFGATYAGGSGNGGLVYSLRPPATACKTALCSWTVTVLYNFTGGSDGAQPGYCNLTFDHAGNLYGTTIGGGAFGQGAVFKLTPSNGGWTESVLYSFSGGSDGSYPYSGVIFDEAGNLYGTTSYGGESGCAPPGGCGTVYQLTPAGPGWKENILYSFQGGNDGYQPYGGLIFDGSGNLYGAAYLGGAGGGGTVFKLSPADGGWTFALVYALSGGAGPLASLAMDGVGNLYGTTVYDGEYWQGSVFKLTRSDSGWTYTPLHDFTGGSDGKTPDSNVTFDANGNLYGTAESGGAYGNGVVWEITP